MMTLDLAIATCRPEGIARVAKMILPPIPGVRYVVSWQAHDNAPIPSTLMRPDVAVHRFDGIGQSLNRNNATGKCTGDIIVFSDDDLIYYPDGLRQLIEAFEKKPEMDFAIFKSIRDGAAEIPPVEIPVGDPLPGNFYVSCFELALRRSTAGHLRFSPEFGLNSSKMHGGEDEIILLSAIRKGLNCRYLPIVVCAHEHPTTGTKARFSNENLRASGCVVALTFPRTAVLRIPLKAWRVWRKGQASLPRALLYLTAGALAAPGVYRRNKEYLW